MSCHFEKDNATGTQFRLYPEGSVQFVDPRVTTPVSFAHVADLHLPPDPPTLWLPRYRHAIHWWHLALQQPNEMLPKLLDEIRAAGVDFILFGGDVLDYYHAESAERIVKLCRARGLTTYFQVGNHDWETEHIRYVTHECDDAIRAAVGEKLCKHWNMPGLYYAFEHHGIRFIVLDTLYGKINGRYAGFFDTEQTNWFLGQLDYDGPMIVFHHVPFNLPTIEYRLRAIWDGQLCGVTEDHNGRRVLSAIKTCPNILGIFAAHAHMRSEDPIGECCQFLAPAGHQGLWRYVKIGHTSLPKSIYVEGEPNVSE